MIFKFVWVIYFMVPLSKGEDVQFPDTFRITLDFQDTDIRDIFSFIAKEWNLNIVLHPDVKGKVSVYFKDVPLYQVLKSLTIAHNYEIEKRGSILFIKPKKYAGKIEVSIRDSLLTLEIENAEVQRVIEKIAKKTKVSLVSEPGVQGIVNGHLYAVPIKQGIFSFFSANGFSVREDKGIFYIGRKREARGRSYVGQKISISEEKRISLEIYGADLAEVIKEIALRTDIDLVIYGNLQGTVNARLTDMRIEDVFAYLLKGSQFGVWKKDNVYFIGPKRGDIIPLTLSSTALLPLSYIKAEDVVSLLPQKIKGENIKIFKEQNALLISGTSEEINEIRDFLKKIDIPSPQVMIEALILEISRSALRELGIEALKGQGSDTASYFPDVSLSYKKEKVEDALNEILKFMRIPKTVSLPKDFLLKISLLESSGKAKVLAKPRVMTLSGNEASIDVGFVRFYRTTTYSPQGPIYQLHSVDAGIRLTITPWVSKTGEIVAVLKTEVSDLRSFGPEGLPEIARRTAQTTVRLKDGESVVIGGLIRKADIESREKVPILGDIPFLGYLFSRTTKTGEESELWIYITPKIVEE